MWFFLAWVTLITLQLTLLHFRVMRIEKRLNDSSENRSEVLR